MKQSKSHLLDIEAHFPYPESIKFGPTEAKKGPKQTKIAFWSHKLAHKPILGWKGYNKVRPPMRTSRQTNFPFQIFHFQDPKCHKSGPIGAKRLSLA